MSQQHCFNNHWSGWMQSLQPIQAAMVAAQSESGADWPVVRAGLGIVNVAAAMQQDAIACPWNKGSGSSTPAVTTIKLGQGEDLIGQKDTPMWLNRQGLDRVTAQWKQAIAQVRAFIVRRSSQVWTQAERVFDVQIGRVKPKASVDWLSV